MEGSRANNQMINITTRQSNYSLNGSGNSVQVSEKIANFFINGGNNKVFLSTKIDTMVINGNGNQINCENQGSVNVFIWFNRLSSSII